MRIGIVGGGPAGLYFALLMKRLDSSHEIRVVEQNPAGGTFGFGVVFSDRALSFLQDADPDSYADLDRRWQTWDDQVIVHRNERVRIDGIGFSGIARLELLQVLKRDPATARIPVLVISIMNDAVKGLTMGAADYLVKPVDRAAVVRAVKRLLDGQGEPEPTVLVVDDEHDTAELIRDTLRSEGLRTQVAHDGRQALELIARKRPDLVILDIMMPEMSGFEVLEALARDQATSTIPVLVLTARGDESDVRRGLALGAKRYLSKPFDLRALIAEVRRHLGTPAPESRRASL